MMAEVFGKKIWNYLRILNSVMVMTVSVLDLIAIYYYADPGYNGYVKILMSYTFLLLSYEFT